jgi:phage terminase large subunit GpA-like protein
MEFLKAKDGGGQTMRVWINTFLAETFEEDATKIDAKELEGRGEEYTPYTIPEGVLTLVAAADVQRNRIECEVKGFGKDEESWGIKRVVLDGDTELDDVWNRLDLLLLEDFTREDGVPLKIQRAFIDMGYKDKRVLSFCAPRIGRGVYPCKGINRVGTNIPPILPAKPSRNNRARIPHWNVGVTVAKSTLHDRISLVAPSARSMHFASPEYGYDADYFSQFASEKRFLKYSYGQPYYIFEKENNSVRNEALDLNVYALAAVHSLFPIAWQRLADNLKKQAPREPVIPKHTPEEVKQLKVEGNHPIEPMQTPPTPPEQPSRDFAAIERSQQAKVARRTGKSGFVGKWRM